MSNGSEGTPRDVAMGGKRQDSIKMACAAWCSMPLRTHWKIRSLRIGEQGNVACCTSKPSSSSNLSSRLQPDLHACSKRMSSQNYRFWLRPGALVCTECASSFAQLLHDLILRQANIFRAFHGVTSIWIQVFHVGKAKEDVHHIGSR